MVIGVVVDNKGVPLCCEMWPGNTSDVTTLKEIVKRFEQCFGIQHVCIVADRGMISKKMVEFLESDASSVKVVREKVLTRGGRYRVVESGSDKKSPLKVKEVLLDDRRYIVCLNEVQARKDATDRQMIIESLRGKLKQGDKSLVGNKGYRKYLKSTAKGHFSIDREKVQQEARYDGKWY